MSSSSSRRMIRHDVYRYFSLSSDNSQIEQSSSSSSFYVHFFHVSTGWTVGRFPHMHPLHLTRSSAQPLFKPSETTSFLPHSPHVFLLLPFRLTPSTSSSLQVLS